jgi:hypothetical protein
MLSNYKRESSLTKRKAKSVPDGTDLGNVLSCIAYYTCYYRFKPEAAKTGPGILRVKILEGVLLR